MMCFTVVRMIQYLLRVIIKNVDDCRKNLIMMVMGYNSMGQYRNIGQQYEEYGYCFFHLLYQIEFLNLQR